MTEHFGEIPHNSEAIHSTITLRERTKSLHATALPDDLLAVKHLGTLLESSMFTENDVTFSHDVSRVQMGQRTRMSCWYSAYRMLYSWKLERKDSEVKERIENSSLDFDHCLQHGLPHPEFGTAQKALFLYGQAGEVIRSMSLDAVRRMIREKGPIWSTMLYEGSNHIVLLTGYYKQTADLLIYNPFNAYSEGSSKPDAHVERKPFDWYQNFLHGVPSAMQYWIGP